MPGPSQPGSKKTKPIPALKGKPATSKTTKPIPALAARRQPVKLQAAPIAVQVGNGQTFTAKNSYRVVRADGSDSGLAVTPNIITEANGQTRENSAAWGVTHVGTGALVGGPYDTVSQTQELAAKLAPLRWTEATGLPPADVEKAKRIVQNHELQPKRSKKG